VNDRGWAKGGLRPAEVRGWRQAPRGWRLEAKKIKELKVEDPPFSGGLKGKFTKNASMANDSQHTLRSA